MHSLYRTAALSALAYSSLTAAAVQQYCPSGSNGICYSVAVPASSASSDSGNIYFQIEGPTSYSWIALGTGDQMDGSNIFIIYQDGNGNVTLSPRLGTDHVEPTEDTSASVTLLEGSGVINGTTMRANVRCANCQKWSGGSMSLSSTSSSWISAWKSGSALDSTDKDATIQQHDDTDTWSLNLQKAQITSDANPFVAASTSSSGSGSGSSSGSDSGSGSGSSSGSDSGSSSSSGDDVSSSGVTQQSSGSPSMMITAHGAIMSIVFVILYPLGSSLMPLLGKWALHATWQLVAFILMWTGFALGIIVSHKTFYDFSVPHTQLGTVVVCLMGIQPVLGYLHHMHYVRHKQRGFVSYAHVAYGWILMSLGIINGGLGLQLANQGTSLSVAYAVVAAVVVLFYVATKIFTLLRSRRQQPRDMQPERDYPHRQRRSVGGGGAGRHRRIESKNGTGSPGEEYEIPNRSYRSGSGSGSN